MTALKINRFNLAEIDTITVRCKQCGAGNILKLAGGHLEAYFCSSCRNAYKNLACGILASLKEAYELNNSGERSFDIEFDILEK